MAMTIRHNEGAEMAINAFNQNFKLADKSLIKLSSGQKFKNANEDAAGYSMSERMIEKIRALFQDDQNVQNGSSMVKTAERGIDQIIDNLRTMKAKAIDAANDSNTDEDRATIQKEIEQRRQVINDIALGTKYNGKILLDGRYTEGIFPLFGGVNNSSQFANSFSASTNAKTGSSTSGGSNAPASWQFKVDASFTRINTGSTFSVEMDFSNLSINGSYPDGLHGQGFARSRIFNSMRRLSAVYKYPFRRH